MILVNRCSNFPFGRFGYISYGNTSDFLLEYPFTGRHKPNAVPPVFCCIPAGDYDLDPHDTQKHPDTWALVNHALGVYHEPIPGMPVDSWTAVLLHPATFASQLEACLSPGTSLYLSNGKLGIGSSEVAWKRVHDYIKATGDLKLRITEGGLTQPWQPEL